MMAAAVMQIDRLIRWAGDRTAGDRLVLVLHVGYAFLPIGFALLGASILDASIVPTSAAIHAWTVGAIGIMTLAVILRWPSTTSPSLRASTGTQAIYLLVLCSALGRIIAGFDGSVLLIEAAGAAWVAAFGGFILLYGPLLLRQRPV